MVSASPFNRVADQEGYDAEAVRRSSASPARSARNCNQNWPENGGCFNGPELQPLSYD